MEMSILKTQTNTLKNGVIINVLVLIVVLATFPICFFMFKEGIVNAKNFDDLFKEIVQLAMPLVWGGALGYTIFRFVVNLKRYLLLSKIDLPIEEVFAVELVKIKVGKGLSKFYTQDRVFIYVHTEEKEDVWVRLKKQKILNKPVNLICYKDTNIIKHL